VIDSFAMSGEFFAKSNLSPSKQHPTPFESRHQPFALGWFRRFFYALNVRRSIR
jgi:hypothetical protein